jgi:membrane-bound ClpP family serine protease
VDVVSEGSFIEAGASIDVIRVDGNRVVVRRARGRQEE